MAEFLTTSGTSYNIENIIINAKDKLILVSPYLQISNTLQERLRDASKRNVKITIIYGKDELKDNEKNSLSELKNLELYFSKNLHAKCYFNENKMVITSMNMYEFSEKNNREMGVLIDREIDKELFEKAENEALSIKQSAEKKSLSLNNFNYSEVKNNFNYSKLNYKKDGHCVRCNNGIAYNPNSPFCKDCYYSWSYFQNADFNENVCHRCGGEYEGITMRKPQCNICFNKWVYEN